MKKRDSYKLCVEELETRLVPSTVVVPPTPPSPYSLSYSTNWSGLDIDTTSGAVTMVSGSWVVPTVTSSGKGSTYSSAWVGIDGDLSGTVEQIGTSSNVVNGKVQYSAWWEMYPANAEQNISSISVHAGDTITASVTYIGNNSFTLSITDTPLGNPKKPETFSITTSLNGATSRNSAEWIMEAPTVGNGQSTPANFGSITFTNAQATIGSITGTPLAQVGNPDVVNYGTASAPEELNLMDMVSVNRRNQITGILDETSILNSGTNPGSSFTVVFGDNNPSVLKTGPTGGGTKAGSDERLVEVVEVNSPTNQPSGSVIVVTVSSGNGVVEILIIQTEIPMFGIFGASGSGQTGIGERDAVAAPSPPPVIPRGTDPVVIRPAFQSEPSGFDYEADGGAFAPPPSEKMYEAPDLPWPSDSRFAVHPHGPTPTVEILSDTTTGLTLPNPGRTLMPDGPIARDADLDALFSNWKPADDAPLSYTGPRLDATDMALATLAVSGLVVWSQERRKEAEGKQPDLRAR